MNHNSKIPPFFRCLAFAALLAGAFLFPQPLRAAITGQWNFDNPANPLAAAVGQALEYFDGPTGDTAAGTQFGDTTSFGIPDINGIPARVMAFPANRPDMGYMMHHGISATPGLFLANQWTLIMDVLFPVSSSGNWRALIQSDIDNPPNDDAEFYLNEANGLGISGAYHGNVPPNTWVRLAIAVDLEAPAPQIVKFINGARVGQHNGTPDMRFALTPDWYALLFTDGYEGVIYTQPGYVASIQIHDTKLTDAYLATLGGPTAAGIATTVQARPYVKSAFPAAGPNATPERRIFVVLQDADTRVNPSTIQLTFDGQPVTATVNQSNGETTIEYLGEGVLAPGAAHTYTLVFSDDANPPQEFTHATTFTVFNYTEIKLPEPLYLETFDSTPEGSLPAGWTEISYTDVTNPDQDLGNLDSASYATWTVVDASRFRGSFVTYSNPDNPPGWGTDYQRVLSVNPGNVVNGKFIRELAQGRFAFGNSGYRNGAGQVLFLFSPDFDLTGKNEIYLSYHSLWEQNQDSIGLVEYSIDGGDSWLPVVYKLDGPDIVRDGSGAIDVEETFSRMHNDVARYTDPVTFEEKGGNYGAFVAAPITSALAPHISARVDDNPVESKRVELFRLPAADNQPRVRLRFGHAGTDSWYFGIDNVGLYSITAAEPPVIVAQPENITVSEGGTVQFTVQASGTPPLGYQWFRNGEPVEGAASATLTLNNVQRSQAGTFHVQVSNAAGSVESEAAVLTVNAPSESIFGMWTFQNQNLMRASGVGELVFADAATGELSSFAGTDGAIVPHLEGAAAQYLRVPAFTAAANGYNLTMPGTQPNGGGDYLNQYSLVWDVLLPGSVNWTPFFNTNPANANDADFYISDAGALGIGALGYSPAGAIAADTWYRIAFVADLGPGTVTYYVNGQQVHQRTGTSLRDGRFSLFTSLDEGPQIRFFNEPTGTYTHELLVSSLFFIDRALTAAEVEALGGPSAAGILLESAPTPVQLQASVAGNAITISWTGGQGPYQVQKTTDLANPQWENLGAPTSENQQTDTISGASAFYRVISSQ